MDKEPTKIEYWLQSKTKTGPWLDCGPDRSPADVFKNIKQLRNIDPSKSWRCIKRSIFDEVIRDEVVDE